MADALSDYGFNKSADATSLNSASLTGFPAYVELESGTDSTGTGIGVLDSSASINGKEDVGFFDENDNPLDFYWVTFDTTNDVYEAWVLTDLVRDGSTEIKVGYGSGSTDDSETRTDVWSGVSGIKAAYDFEGDASDVTGNGYDGTTNGVNFVDSELGQSVEISNDGEYIDIPNNFGISASGSITIITYFNKSSFPADDTPSNADELIQFRGEHQFFPAHFGDNAEPTALSMRMNNTNDWITRAQSSSLSTNTWYMGDTSYDGSNGYKVGIDGTNEDTNTTTESQFDTNNLDNLIGNEQSDSYERPFDGKIAILQIYDVEKSQDWRTSQADQTPKAGYSLFSWNASETTSTKVTATPALGQGTPITAQTTGILGNWRAFKDARITERTQVKVEGGHAQKWEIDASKTTAERAVYRADQTLDLDMSTAFGTTSGGFTQGTIGWHIRVDDTSILRSTDALQLRVGSSPGDYAVWTLDRSELGPNGEYKYLTFSHDEHDSIIGTPDWTNVDFFELTMFETSGNTTDTFIYVDYLTVSDRDDVGATGIGDRRSDKEQIRSGD